MSTYTVSDQLIDRAVNTNFDQYDSNRDRKLSIDDIFSLFRGTL